MGECLESDGNLFLRIESVLCVLCCDLFTLVSHDLFSLSEVAILPGIVALRGEGTKGLFGTNALLGGAGGDLVRRGTRFGDVTAEKLVRYIWGTRVTT